jgi:hypothetical protein
VAVTVNDQKSKEDMTMAKLEALLTAIWLQGWFAWGYGIEDCPVAWERTPAWINWAVTYDQK